jgi:hypothetical protein
LTLPPPPTVPEPEPFTNRKPERVGSPRAAVVAGLAIVALIFAAVGSFVWLSEPSGKKVVATSPSPTAGPNIVAPSDEVVQEELEQQLKLYQEGGEQAADARLASYRRGLGSAGCKVGLAHGAGFDTTKEAAAAALAYITQARTVLTEGGATFGAGAVTAATDTGVQYFVIFVVCPPAGATP